MPVPLPDRGHASVIREGGSGQNGLMAASLNCRWRPRFAFGGGVQTSLDQNQIDNDPALQLSCKTTNSWFVIRRGPTAHAFSYALDSYSESLHVVHKALFDHIARRVSKMLPLYYYPTPNYSL